MVLESDGNAVLYAAFVVEIECFSKIHKAEMLYYRNVCKTALEHIPLCSFVSPSAPQPRVAMSANHTSPLYAGTGLILTCTVSLHSSVDTNVSVSVTWTGPRPIPGERYSVMEASGSGGTYTGSLTISPLAEGQDDGQYTCSVTVGGGSSVLEATGSDAVTIDVMGKYYIN